MGNKNHSFSDGNKRIAATLFLWFLIAQILPPSNPFLPESGEKKRTVIERLKAFLSKFLNTTEDSYYEAPQTAKIYTMPDEEHELSQAAEEEER